MLDWVSIENFGFNIRKGFQSLTSKKVIKIDADGFRLISVLEGCRLKPYKDSANKWTIGYGHLLSDTEYLKYKNGITQKQADSLLSNDISKREIQVAKVAPNCTQQEFNALTSFVFNLGINALTDGTVLYKFLSGNKEGAAKTMLQYNKVTIDGKLVVVPGLTRRRKCEVLIFNGGTTKLLDTLKWYS